MSFKARGERREIGSPSLSPFIRLCGLLFAAWLCCAPASWANSESRPSASIGPLFDEKLDDVAQQAEQARGNERIRLGLLLADLTAAEKGELQALEILDDLPEPAEVESALGIGYRAYQQATTCVVKQRLGQVEEAFSNCEAAYASLDSVEDPFLRMRVLYANAFIAVRQGELSRAFELSQRTLDMANVAGSRYAEAAANNLHALVLLFGGIHQEAVSRFEEARRLSVDFPDRAMGKILEFNLGMAYLEVDDPEQALASFRTGAEWAEQTGQPHRLLIGRTQMARALLELGRPQQGVDLLRPVLFEDRDHDPDSWAHAYLIYARLHVALGEPAKALDFVEQGLTQLGDGNPMRRAQLILGRIRALRGLDRSGEALELVRHLIADLRSRDADELDEALHILSELAAETGQYELAYRAEVEAHFVERASRGANLELQMSMITAAHALESAEKEADLARQREEALRARAQRDQSIFIGLLSVLALGVFALLLNRARQEQTLVADRQRQLSEELEVLVNKRTEALEKEMTERMRGEMGRRELERQLAEADKMRAIGQLTGGVAHDFNNLLTVVTSAAELLDSHPEMPEKDRHSLIDSILAAASTGREVNRGLLAYARQQPLTPEPVEIGPYLDESRKLFEQTIGPEMLIEMKVVAGCIRVDRSQLTTAIINLLLNARDASNNRGTIHITAEPDEARDVLVLEVADDGRGMTSQQVDQAIEPFYSTKDSTHSSGLGLSMVYGFVRQSGGQLDIDSSEGHGTTVRMTFPLSEARDERPGEHQVAELQQDLHALLVDDNQDVAKIVGHMLERMGATVAIATSGDKALTLLEDQRPDILISDVLMPGELNGVELADAARLLHPRLPILLISGFAEQTNLSYPMLCKPFTADELERVISKLVPIASSDSEATDPHPPMPPDGPSSRPPSSPDPNGR